MMVKKAETCCDAWYSVLIHKFWWLINSKFSLISLSICFQISILPLCSSNITSVLCLIRNLLQVIDGLLPNLYLVSRSYHLNFCVIIIIQTMIDHILHPNCTWWSGGSSSAAFCIGVKGVRFTCVAWCKDLITNIRTFRTK